MEVIVFASRKGGSGKSTLTAHIAAHVHKPSRPCLLIDADPQGSLALWHKLRAAAGEADDLPIKSAQRHIADVVKQAKADGVEWVFIDTPPNTSASVTDAIGTATLVVIPCRPGVFDLDAVKQTIECAREARKPYAVIINAAPPKRQDVESPTVTHAREILGALQIPVWGGQITQRANFSAALAEGEGAKEYDSGSTAAAEVARLWVAIEKSVKAIHGAREGGMHRVAA
jgi:cellulose biosynthesis protein BcsQ